MKGKVSIYNDNTDVFEIKGEDGRRYYCPSNDMLFELGENSEIDFNYKTLRNGEFKLLVVTSIKKTNKNHSYQMKKTNKK